MPILFNIATGSPTPIYKQITDQVRLAVATGNAQTGEPLPSVRSLAEELLVNPNTVARAYADLAREGLVDTRPGLGVFVARKRRVFSRPEARRRLEPLLDAVLSEAVALDYTPESLREAFEQKLAEWNRPNPEQPKP